MRIQGSFGIAIAFFAIAEGVFALPSSNHARNEQEKKHGKGEPSGVFSVQLDGVTYVNKGLVAFGLIPSDFKESTGDTLGGIGSAIDIRYGTFKAKGNKFTGTFVVQPDRGYNVDHTIDYQARQHEIDFVLQPYYGTKNLSFSDAQKTLKLTYKKTILKTERNKVKTSGLDPLAVRPARTGLSPLDDPEMPIASTAEPHLSIDAEGLVSNADGTFWISDEYGPYIYKYSADGKLIRTIQPPKAILPHDGNGNLNFTSESGPATGRVGNQGFEGLTLDHNNQVLYAMLQSAAMQDGGADKSTSRHTRLVAYDVKNEKVRPALVGEWVVPLPQSDKGNTRASSEIKYVSPGVFMSLSRDGDGRGGGDNKTNYKRIDIFSTTKATDIRDTKFDDPQNPIAIGGKLDASITPAEYVSFVDIADPVQLARFGLHNGSPNDPTLIDGKWESLALASVEDNDFPDDYFLFTAADNDFISTHGVSLGVPFDGGLDVDNQFLVYRVTLPGIAKYHKELSHKH